jgi:hypothetical protein
MAANVQMAEARSHFLANPSHLDPEKTFTN